MYYRGLGLGVRVWGLIRVYCLISFGLGGIGFRFLGLGFRRV